MANTHYNIQMMFYRNLCDFINQWHPNKFNEKVKKKERELGASTARAVGSRFGVKARKMESLPLPRHCMDRAWPCGGCEAFGLPPNSRGSLAEPPAPEPSLRWGWGAEERGTETPLTRSS